MSNIQKHKSFQQPINYQYNTSTNPIHKNLVHNNYNINTEKKSSMSQKYVLGAMDQTNSLFDEKSTKSALGFIPPEPEKHNKQNKNIKTINLNNIQENIYNKVDIINSNSNRNKKSPVDEISNNSSSNNRNIQSISPLNSDRDMGQANLRNKKLVNNIYNNNQTNINNNTFNNLPNKNTLLNNSGNNIINNKTNSNQNIVNISSNNNSTDKKNNNINNVKTTNIQNQFMNRNIDMLAMLKGLQFFERLNEIGKERMKIFENEFQRDNFFMKKDFFDNTFIKESEIDKLSPLTLIFHFIFNPETEISQYPFKKCFFESIFKLRGDKNIKITYSPNDLKQVPKYFKDFNYVNNLFNNFNENDLNTFLNEIKQWKKIFSFDLQFVHPLQNNIGQNQIEIKDDVKVYFVSPNDLIVDYHSYAENFPLSETFVSISQYNFHCDINYDENNGRFTFKTNAIVYNKLQIIKETIIQNLIKKEANGVNSVELLVNTWKPLLNIVREESKKNKLITDKIFKEYLRKNLNKYSKNKPQINSENKELNLKSKINKNINNNINNNISNKISSNINNNNINNNLNNNMNIYEENYENNKFNENINKNDKIYNDLYSGRNNNNEDIIDSKKNYINNNNKELKEKNNVVNTANNNINVNNEEDGQNNLLYYGVLISFFLFIFKTFLSIENGNVSSETFFNFLIIIIIGFMLVKNNFIVNNNNNNDNHNQ